jgi:predicted nucleic acid-binding protein
MKVFLDANIIVSVLNKEYPLFTYSARILSLTDNNKFSIYTSPLCLAIAFYFTEKKSGAVSAKKKIELLASKIKVTDVDESCVTKAIRNKAVSDFEDGLQYYSAEKSKCECIVTEDGGDFFFSKIEVIKSRDFIEKYVM